MFHQLQESGSVEGRSRTTAAWTRTGLVWVFAVMTDTHGCLCVVLLSSDECKFVLDGNLSSEMAGMSWTLRFGLFLTLKFYFFADRMNSRYFLFFLIIRFVHPKLHMRASKSFTCCVFIYFHKKETNWWRASVVFFFLFCATLWDPSIHHLYTLIPTQDLLESSVWDHLCIFHFHTVSAEGRWELQVAQCSIRTLVFISHAFVMSAECDLASSFWKMWSNSWS